MLLCGTSFELKKTKIKTTSSLDLPVLHFLFLEERFELQELSLYIFLKKFHMVISYLFKRDVIKG